jgi:hypothetical protein
MGFEHSVSLKLWAERQPGSAAPKWPWDRAVNAAYYRCDNPDAPAFVRRQDVENYLRSLFEPFRRLRPK